MNLEKLINWSQTEFTHLPWRKNRTLYKTLVSEIMLQQTTVGTVKNHFERFLKKFPTIESLALATEEELLVAWKGLGYYRRAKNLKKIAEAIVNDHKGDFPDCADELQKIPGIGPYTSQALIAIGMDQRGLAIDANLERVISRLFALKQTKGPKLQKEIFSLFEKNRIFSSKTISYRALNEALMDLGRTYCQSRKASCEICPMSKNCKAKELGSPQSFPLAKEVNKEKSQEHELELLRVFVIKENKILVYKKMDGEWLSGQYEAPTYIMRTTDPSLSQYPYLNLELNLEKHPTLKTSITKYKIKNYLCVTETDFLRKIDSLQKFEWKDFNDEKSNLSTATLKGLRKVLRSML